MGCWTEYVSHRRGLSYQQFGGVGPNPRVGLTRGGKDSYRYESRHDYRVGGGSVIDTAKAIAWRQIPMLIFGIYGLGSNY